MYVELARGARRSVLDVAIVALLDASCAAPTCRVPGATPCCANVDECIATVADPHASWESLEVAVDVISRGSKSRAELDRLRALLEQELHATPLARPPDTVAGEAEPSRCLPGNDFRRAPRAVFLIAAIESFVQEASPAQAELREAYHSADAYVSNAATWPLARLVDDEVLPRIIDDAASRIPLCVDLDLYWLRAYGPRARAALPVLTQLLRDTRMPGLPAVLAAIGDPAAIEPLGQALDHEDCFFRAQLLEALASFGPAAGAQRPAVELLTHNWSPNVRASANEALRAIAGVQPPPYSPPTARLTPANDGFRLTLQGETISLSKAFEWPRPEGHCDPISKSVGADHAVDVQGTCVLVRDGVGRNSLFVAERDGRTTPLSKAQVAAVRVVHGRIFAIAAGQILQLESPTDGPWSATSVASLPGRPIALGSDQAGNLVVVVRGSDDLSRDERGWRVRRGASTTPDSEQPLFALRLNDVTGQLQGAQVAE